MLLISLELPLQYVFTI
uniref:Uncharacterized protein n=1 Tax=Arundo donax TaxID=35708 RepID=A0A0A9GEB2_ARUDO